MSILIVLHTCGLSLRIGTDWLRVRNTGKIMRLNCRVSYHDHCFDGACRRRCLLGVITSCYRDRAAVFLLPSVMSRCSQLALPTNLLLSKQNAIVNFKSPLTRGNVVVRPSPERIPHRGRPARFPGISRRTHPGCWRSTSPPTVENFSMPQYRKYPASSPTLREIASASIPSHWLS